MGRPGTGFAARPSFRVSALKPTPWRRREIRWTAQPGVSGTPPSQSHSTDAATCFPAFMRPPQQSSTNLCGIPLSSSRLDLRRGPRRKPGAAPPRPVKPVRIAGQLAFSVCRIASSEALEGGHFPNFCAVSGHCFEDTAPGGAPTGVEWRERHGAREAAPALHALRDSASGLQAGRRRCAVVRSRRASVNVSNPQVKWHTGFRFAVHGTQ